MSSMDMLKASMTLPLPTGKYFTEDDVKYDENGVNLIDYVATNANNLDKIGSATPIIKLNGNSVVNVKQGEDYHEQFKKEKGLYTR